MLLNTILKNSLYTQSQNVPTAGENRVWDAVSGGFEFSQKMAMSDGDQYPLNN